MTEEPPLWTLQRVVIVCVLQWEGRQQQHHHPVVLARSARMVLAMVRDQDRRSLQDCSVEECLNCGLGLVVVRRLILLLHHRRRQVYITN